MEFITNFNVYLEKSNGRLVPNMDLLRKHLLREGPIEKEHLVEIIRDATSFLSKLLFTESDIFIFYAYREGTKCN